MHGWSVNSSSQEQLLKSTKIAHASRPRWSGEIECGQVILEDGGVLPINLDDRDDRHIF